ncbi:XRE family transcriptional regulator [Saccharomonospora sp. CUA-673]|uniref:XRE family transcriptional regulator n=1 Tax=Saccharomonospora sp. CUA-673 TaxID=1904969 RepID=UPI0013014DFB|nr:XRE family transcriptional regulator [Saccharomonospora sp. CUA-673]
MDQLTDDVRRLTGAYQQQPLEQLLGDIADTQSRAFSLLGGHVRPDQARDLYLLAGVASGLMAKASHDLGSPSDAMTQARAAYSAADNAGHDGLRAWVRGLQALVSYWSGQLVESARYARKGAEFARQTRGTSSVWLASSEARSLAAQGDVTGAQDAIDRATEAREHATGDELDELGGLCRFGRPRQLYYSADALAWGGGPVADRTEVLAGEALDAYAHAPAPERAFGDEAGTRCALAIARVHRGEIDGAAEAVAPVLELPSSKRIHGVVTAVDQVRRAVQAVEGGPVGGELHDRLHTFSSEPLTLPQ